MVVDGIAEFGIQRGHQDVDAEEPAVVRRNIHRAGPRDGFKIMADGIGNFRVGHDQFVWIVFNLRRRFGCRRASGEGGESCDQDDCDEHACPGL